MSKRIGGGAGGPKTEDEIEELKKKLEVLSKSITLDNDK